MVTGGEVVVVVTGDPVFPVSPVSPLLPEGGTVVVGAVGAVVVVVEPDPVFPARRGVAASCPPRRSSSRRR